MLTAKKPIFTGFSGCFIAAVNLQNLDWSFIVIYLKFMRISRLFWFFIFSIFTLGIANTVLGDLRLFRADTLIRVPLNMGNERHGFRIGLADSLGLSLRPGFELSNDTGLLPYYLDARLLPMDSFWLSFQYCFKKWRSIKGGAREPLPLYGLRFSSKANQGNFSRTIGFILVPGREDSPTHVLRMTVRPSEDPGLERSRDFACSMEGTHSVELEIRFVRQDSLSFELHLDGQPVWAAGAPSFLEHDETGVLLTGNRIRNSDFRLLLDPPVLFTDARPFVFPLQPASMEETLSPEGLCSLRVTPPVSNYKGERLTVVRRQLYMGNDTLFPILDHETRDPFLFGSLRVPFPLDSGRYRWRVRLTNHFNRTNDWSSLKSFEVPTGRALPFRLHSAFITGVPKGPVIKVITPGVWYDLHVWFDSATGAGGPGYLVAWLSAQGRGAGNPATKGGPFLPESNYPMNLSTSERPGEYKLFEKDSGTNDSRIIDPERPGIYLDEGPETRRFHRSAGSARLRFRLLPEASPGPWMLTVYGRGADEALSNILRVPFEVAAPKQAVPVSRGRLAGIVAGFLAALAVLFVRLHQSRKALPVPEHPDMERIRQYVKTRLASEISLTQLSRDVSIGLNRVSKLIKASGEKSLPSLVAKLRIEKAKELLRDPRNNVADIALATGFEDPSYFSRVFREIEGISPSDYRKKVLRLPV